MATVWKGVIFILVIGFTVLSVIEKARVNDFRADPVDKCMLAALLVIAFFYVWR